MFCFGLPLSFAFLCCVVFNKKPDYYRIQRFESRLVPRSCHVMLLCHMAELLRKNLHRFCGVGGPKSKNRFRSFCFYAQSSQSFAAAFDSFERPFQELSKEYLFWKIEQLVREL